MYGKKNSSTPISSKNACHRLTFSHQAISGTPRATSPPSNNSACTTRTQALCAMARRLSSRSNIPLKTTFQARARPAMRTVTMPISSIGFFMIQASNGVQIRMASSSKPMA
ncbi:hypothetical protein D9M73_189350 [compost metagenome]